MMYSMYAQMGFLHMHAHNSQGRDTVCGPVHSDIPYISKMGTSNCMKNSTTERSMGAAPVTYKHSSVIIECVCVCTHTCALNGIWITVQALAQSGAALIHGIEENRSSWYVDEMYTLNQVLYSCYK